MQMALTNIFLKKQMNKLGLPVFEAKINGESDGILAIALVDSPAVESNFMFFNKLDENKVIQQFSIQDEEKHIITGVVMRADFPIYRYDVNYGEYYIFYSADTIKVMAEKMMNDNTFNSINIMHDDDKYVNGVNIVELFIKDKTKGIDPVGFEEIEEGSLFATYKVNNDQIWGEIKSGEFKGFSLQGIFSIEQSTKYDFENKNTLKKYMNRLTKKIVNSIVKFGSVKTDQGELYWVGEGQLEIGDELFKEEGEDRVKVEDGTYVTEDKVEITVTEGLVSEIKTPEVVEETPAEEEDMKKKKAACEDEDPVDDDPAKEDDVRAEIDDLKAAMETMKAEIERLRGEIEAIKGEPAQQPVMDEYEKVAKFKTNDSKINNAISIVSKLKK